MKTTKQKIFDSAIDLFSKKGFSGVSIREIARSVGIKESSLYNHFKNKDDILAQIFDYFQVEMKKTALSEEYLDQKISNMTAEEFWEKGLTIFQQATLKPEMQKISKIVLLEMLNDKRAKDIAIEEFFTRQQKVTETIFILMQKKGLIKKFLDAKILAQEYSYGLLGMQFEYNILNNWNLDTADVVKKMLNHIAFISEYAKVVKKGENNE
jgi:AcrR family transcriptional regulator